MVGKQLVGEDDVAVDAKGRVLLDKKMRERLGYSFAMGLGELGCICVFPELRWHQHLEEIERSDPLNEGRKRYSRLFFATADDEMSCDAQGRVGLPKRLKELANIQESVKIVGCGDHLEIWNPGEYEQWFADPDSYGGPRRIAMDGAYRAMKGLSAQA